MKAIILAAGEGRRLEPLTNRRPKPMVPIANEPLLEYVVEAVAAAGIEELVLVVGYKRDRIQTHFGDGDDWGVSIEYAVQEKQLGTGHAVLQAEPHVDDEFVVLNGDRIVEPSVVEAVIDAEREEGGCVMAVTRSDQPSDYGVVDLSGDRVTGITEKPRATDSPSGIINAGVYRFAANVFGAIRDCETGADGEVALTNAIEQLQDDDGVRAVRYRGLWLDISYLWDVPGVSRRVIDRFGPSRADSAVLEEGAVVANAVVLGADVRVGPNATVRPGTALGENVTVGANAVLSNVVALPGATIEAGAVLSDCVVGENASIGANVTASDTDASVVVDGSVHEDVPLGAVVGDYTEVGAGTVFDPGTVVGDVATIEAGCTVSGHIAPETEVRRG